MRYNLLVKDRRGAVHIAEAEAILGGPLLMDLARRAGWLTPVIQRRRLTLFDYDDCIGCWKRIIVEGYDALALAAGKSPAPTAPVGE